MEVGCHCSRKAYCIGISGCRCGCALKITAALCSMQLAQGSSHEHTHQLSRNLHVEASIRQWLMQQVSAGA